MEERSYLFSSWYLVRGWKIKEKGNKEINSNGYTKRYTKDGHLLCCRKNWHLYWKLLFPVVQWWLLNSIMSQLNQTTVTELLEQLSPPASKLRFILFSQPITGASSQKNLSCPKSIVGQSHDQWPFVPRRNIARELRKRCLQRESQERRLSTTLRASSAPETTRPAARASRALDARKTKRPICAALCPWRSEVGHERKHSEVERGKVTNFKLNFMQVAQNLNRSIIENQWQLTSQQYHMWEFVERPNQE